MPRKKKASKERRSAKQAEQISAKKAKMLEEMKKRKGCRPKRICVHPVTGEVEITLHGSCPKEYVEAYVERIPKKGVRFTYRDEFED